MFKARRSEILLTLAAVMFASNGIASKLLLNDYISAWRLAQVRSISTFFILAKRLSLLVGKDVPILGQIPFSPALREGGDTGIPVVVSNPESSAAKVFDEIMARIIVRPKSLVGVRLGLST